MPGERGIPGGRGLRRGQDAWVAQQEAWRQRSELNPRRDLSYVACGSVFGTKQAAYNGTANDVVLVPLPQLERDATLHEARCSIQNAHASNTLRTSIYVYSPDSESFTMIPGSEVVFPTDATGTQMLTCPAEFTMTPENMYFLGFKSSGTTATYAASASSILGILYIAAAAGSMPKSLKLKNMTFGDLWIPTVAYLSRALVNVL